VFDNPEIILIHDFLRGKHPENNIAPLRITSQGHQPSQGEKEHVRRKTPRKK
jgi:hypothetical protein